MASKMKKVVSKDELRRLMKETKATVKGSSSRISHPLAKYNSLNQLVCVLCNTAIKSEILWTAHLGSRQHKEKLEFMKTAGPKAPPDISTKRKADNTAETAIPNKKVKENGTDDKSSGGLPSDFFDSKKLSSSSSQKSSHKSSVTPKATNNQLGLGSYSASSSSEDEEEEETGDKRKSSSISSSMQSSVQLSHPALPPDFFDAGVKTEEPEEEEKPKTMADVLPEGFFDNPKADAKVRQVEYKDKMDEEWEMFQRAMKEETHVSEAIMDVEDEQLIVERSIDEIDDQMNRWKEINTLEIKKEEIMQKKTEKSEKEKEESDDELEEEDLEDFLNWRSKKLK